MAQSNNRYTHHHSSRALLGGRCALTLMLGQDTLLRRQINEERKFKDSVERGQSKELVMRRRALKRDPLVRKGMTKFQKRAIWRRLGLC